ISASTAGSGRSASNVSANVAKAASSAREGWYTGVGGGNGVTTGQNVPTSSPNRSAANRRISSRAGGSFERLALVAMQRSRPSPVAARLLLGRESAPGRGHCLRVAVPALAAALARPVPGRLGVAGVHAEVDQVVGQGRPLPGLRGRVGEDAAEPLELVVHQRV